MLHGQQNINNKKNEGPNKSLLAIMREATKNQRITLKSQVSFGLEFINAKETNALNPLKPSGKHTYHQNKN